jgi:soluble lytic murein transglycosylase-like protein
MLQDMTKVLNRINEIQKRFNPNRNYSFNVENKTTKKNFTETLNEQMSNVNKSEDLKNIKTDIPASMIKDIAKGYAVKNGLPPALVDAVIKVESDYNPNAISKKGAAGLMQIMPDALKDMEVSNPFNVEDNIQAGVNILKKLMDKYEWDFKKVLAAYNAGEKAVDKNGNIPPIKETKEYVKKVIDAYIQNIK